MGRSLSMEKSIPCYRLIRFDSEIDVDVWGKRSNCLMSLAHLFSGLEAEFN